MKKVLVCLLLAYSSNSFAIAVSSLFVSADSETSSGDIVVVNNDGKDMFINIEMSKVTYVNGEKKVIKVNKDNLSNWSFSVSPTQLILAPGEKRKIRMKNSCAISGCDFDEDQIYAVDLTPVPYSEGKASSVAVSFGYRVYFLDPAKKINLDYEIRKINHDKFRFDNKSNTMLNAIINVCEKKYSSDCIYEYKVLAGANKIFKLPNNALSKGKVLVNVVNANEDIHEKLYL